MLSKDSVLNIIAVNFVNFASSLTASKPKWANLTWLPVTLSVLDVIIVYTIIKLMPMLWLVNQLWFIVPVNPWKFRVSSELLYKSNRPQVSMVYSLINHLWCWKNTWRICKSLACGSWFTNSSRILPTSRVVYQAINYRNFCLNMCGYFASYVIFFGAP